MQNANGLFSVGMRLQACVYALVILSAVIFSETVADPTYLLLTVIASALAWWLFESRRPQRYVPKVFLNLFVLGSASYLFYEVTQAWGNQSVITALSHFIIALQLSKLFDEKKSRDVVQLIVLSMLVVVSSAMFSTSSIFFAGMIGAFVALLAYTALAFHLSLETQKAMSAAEPLATVEGTRLPMLRLDLRRVTRYSLALVIPLAAGLFLVIPRSNGSPIAPSWNLGSYQTGFNDVVQFHDYGVLNQSDAVVMTVTLSRQGGGDIGRDVNDFYFRGQVLTEYNPEFSRWEHGQSDGPWGTVLPTDDSNGVDYSDKLIQQDYEMLIPPAGGRRFILGPTQVEQVDLGYVYSQRDITLRHAAASRVDKSYHVSSLLKPESNIWQIKEPAFVAVGVLRSGRVNARQEEMVPRVMVSRQITELARSLAKDYLPAAGQAMSEESIRPIMGVYETYLRTHYPYSLKIRQVDAALDPTTDFLMNRQDTGGHCEFFASAMVMMCRAVGLNARMVVGFHGGELNPLDKGYTVSVRQKDAHAWAEVYVPSEGWVTSDPSPARNDAGASSEMTVLRWGHQFVQLLQNYWLSFVVSFDNQSRQAVMSSVREIMQGFTGFFSNLMAGSTISDQLLKVAVIGPLVGLFAVIIWFLRRLNVSDEKQHVAGVLRRGGTARTSSGVAFLEDLMVMLERTGTPRRRDQTPREFVEQLAPRMGAAVVDARRIILTAYEVRFGRQPMSSEMREQVALALRQVRNTLKASLK